MTESNNPDAGSTSGGTSANTSGDTAGETATDNPGRGRRPYRYVRGYQAEGGGFAPTNTHRGRPGSWIAVAVFFIGFLAGGLGVSLGANWWLIGIGLVVMAAGGVLFLMTDIFTDVVLDDPRRESEEPHNTPLHRIKSVDRQRAEREEGHRAAADDLPVPGGSAADRYQHRRGARSAG
ncbi:hypothetical protein GCM10027570_21430 [Streptomonospora sediminis]